MNTYYNVILKLNGDIVGSSEGVPCMSLERAKHYARYMKRKHGEHLSADIINAQTKELEQ